ncbi:hypothetical protein HQ535_13145, partial [bacterium]|nr:hypothetical protein [bacterium]
MLPATLLLAATLTILAPSADDLAPGDGLGLVSDAPSASMPAGGGSGLLPGGGGPMSPFGFAAALGALAAGLAAAGGFRPVVRDDDPIVVMVPGWGSA